MRITAVLITREERWPYADTKIDQFPFDEILVETRCQSVWRRFELAQQARHDHIYMQDDDCRINIQHLFNEYDGEHITNAITPQHFREYSGTGETLIGWGSFFPKRLVNFSEWRESYGDLYLDRAPERVFTLLHQPHWPVVMDIQHFNRPIKMWTQPDHFEVRAKIRRLASALGKA